MENSDSGYQAQQSISIIEFLMELPNLIALLYLAVVGNSLILWVDALDSFGNTFYAFFLYMLSKRIRTANKFAYNYGVGKIEAIGAVCVSGVIIFGLIIVVICSAMDFISPKRPGDVLGYAVLLKMVNCFFDFWVYKREQKAVAVSKSQVLDAALAHAKKNLIFDLITLFSILISFIFRDTQYIGYAVPIFCICIAMYLLRNALGDIRRCADDLLDKTLDEESQLRILKVLTDFHEEYAEFKRVRSRRSGNDVFIDLLITFPSELPYASIEDITRRMDERMREMIPESKTSILIVNREG